MLNEGPSGLLRKLWREDVCGRMVERDLSKGLAGDSSDIDTQCFQKVLRTLGKQRLSSLQQRALVQVAAGDVFTKQWRHARNLQL